MQTRKKFATPKIIVEVKEKEYFSHFTNSVESTSFIVTVKERETLHDDAPWNQIQKLCVKTREMAETHFTKMLNYYGGRR